MKRYLGLIAALSQSAAYADTAAEARASEEDVVRMPTLLVVDSVAANDMPSAGFATPVTALRYMHSVDVQSRGFAETQSDVVIRGGIFENTGFKVGALNLMDPQTGHYGSELPIDPLMLGNPKIATGVNNAFSGFNASVGTVSYAWLPITNTGTVEIGTGTESLFFSRFVSGYLSGPNTFLGRSVGVQVSSAYSEGDGTVEYSDHQFQRYGMRIQLAGQGGQTDLYAGYQKKFYGWPGMYSTSAAYPETDKYEVAMLILNHTQKYGEGSHWSFGAYTRKLLDDYELRRTTPGFFRPYEHETLASGLALEGEHRFGYDVTLDWRAEAAADKIESTELTYAGFMNRSYWKGSVLLGKQQSIGPGDLLLQGGISYEDSNRDSSGTGPMARATYIIQAGRGYITSYIEYSRSTQLNGYTAIGSNPGLGSFSGNADLGREVADNHELGIQWNCCNFTIGGAVFNREHKDLADWTYDSTQPRIFRKASPMDLRVNGFECYASWSLEKKLSISLGYTYLNVDANYESGNVDASFYAMNYPTNRITGSLVWQIVKSLEFRADADIRRQEINALRKNGDTGEFFSASLGWSPEFVKGMTISIIMDNISDCDFQEFPGVPASGRQTALRVAYTW